MVLWSWWRRSRASAWLKKRKNPWEFGEYHKFPYKIRAKKYQKVEISRIGFRTNCIGVLLSLIASTYLDLPKETFNRYLVDLCLYGFGWSASVSSVHLRIAQKISFLCLHLWPPFIDAQNLHVFQVSLDHWSPASHALMAAPNVMVVALRAASLDWCKKHRAKAHLLKSLVPSH